MSDVEKYGLFAIVLVGGLLLIVAVSGGFSGEDPPAAPAMVAAGEPIVLNEPSALRGPDGDAATLRSVHVPPLLTNDKPFDFNEQPVVYPGDRSSAPIVPYTSSPNATPSTAQSAAQTAPQSAAPKAAPATVTPAKSEVATYTVRAGDTLADIAQRELGSSKRWAELVKLNPGLDPKHLKIGTTIRLAGSAPAPATQAAPLVAANEKVAPAKASADKPVASAARTHTVVSGDTLGGIAKKYLGSTKRANDLYEANKDVLKSPDALKVGQVLRIP